LPQLIGSPGLQGMEEDDPEHEDDADAAGDQQPSSSRRRRGRSMPPPAVDVVSMLPDDVDDETLKNAWAKLPVKHRSAKAALLRQHRSSFSSWRFQLR